jgi:hypothetical protein
MAAHRRGGRRFVGAGSGCRAGGSVRPLGGAGVHRRQHGDGPDRDRDRARIGGRGRDRRDQPERARPGGGQSGQRVAAGGARQWRAVRPRGAAGRPGRRDLGAVGADPYARLDLGRHDGGGAGGRAPDVAVDAPAAVPAGSDARGGDQGRGAQPRADRAGFRRRRLAYRQGPYGGHHSDGTDARWEAMRPLLAGKTPLFIHAIDLQQIREALDFTQRRGLKFTLVGGQDAWRVADAAQGARRAGDPAHPVRTAAAPARGRRRGLCQCRQARRRWHPAGDRLRRQRLRRNAGAQPALRRRRKRWPTACHGTRACARLR